jgi:hypothetical protein
MLRKLLFCTIAGLALVAMAACDKPSMPDPEQPPEPQAGHTQLRDAIQQPLDKARAVEDAGKRAAEAQRAAIEEAGG